jgi:hypothetical protein
MDFRFILIGPHFGDENQTVCPTLKKNHGLPLGIPTKTTSTPICLFFCICRTITLLKIFIIATFFLVFENKLEQSNIQFNIIKCDLNNYDKQCVHDGQDYNSFRIRVAAALWVEGGPKVSHLSPFFGLNLASKIEPLKNNVSVVQLIIMHAFTPEARNN